MQSSNPNDMAYDDGFRAGKAESQHRITDLERQLAEIERQLAGIEELVGGVDWFSPGSVYETLRKIEITSKEESK